MAKETIAIIGLGKLGAPIAACFASKGFPVRAVDLNPHVVKQFNDGLAPVFEPGLQDLISNNRDRISASVDVEAAVNDAAVSFILVPTPSESFGGFSLKYVISVCESISKALQKRSDFPLIVLTSTVMPGATGSEVRRTLEQGSGKKAGIDFGLCYSPEFVALGSVIHDFFHPDFLLIGESDPTSGEMLASLYRKVCNNEPPIARMNFVNAELTKLSVNTFVTTKITFANMLARICEHLPDADVEAVTGALALDQRIGGKYLKGAIGYGGPCFPRDNLALSALARSLDVPAVLAESTDRANRNEVHILAALVQSKLPSSKSVGILGLSYKPETNVVEESQGLLLAQALTAKSIAVVAYDPAGMEPARKVVGNSVQFATSADDCVRQAAVIVITTPWKQFQAIRPELLQDRIVIDCWRLLKNTPKDRSVEYIELGKGRVLE